MNGPCKTPGAIFHISTQLARVECTVNMPDGVRLDLDEGAAKKLEDEVHDAMEAVLAQFFPSSQTPQGLTV